MRTFNEWLLETHWSDENDWQDEEESESEHNEKLKIVDLVKRLLKAGRDHDLLYPEKWKGEHLHKAIQKAAKKLNMDVGDVTDMWWDVTGPKPFGKSWHDIHPDHRDKDPVSLDEPEWEKGERELNDRLKDRANKGGW